MNCFSYPIRFPQNWQPTVSLRSAADGDEQLDTLDRLKMREDALEARRRNICNGGKPDDEIHPIAGTLPIANSATDSEDDADNQSTSSFSVNETSDEEEHNDSDGEDIPYDESGDDDLVVDEDDDAEIVAMNEVDMDESHLPQVAQQSPTTPSGNREVNEWDTTAESPDSDHV